MQPFYGPLSVWRRRLLNNLAMAFTAVTFLTDAIAFLKVYVIDPVPSQPHPGDWLLRIRLTAPNSPALR